MADYRDAEQGVMKTARIRIGKVTPKKVVWLVPRAGTRIGVTEIRTRIEDALKQEGDTPLAGMMAIMWDEDGCSNVCWWTSAANTIPRLLAVEFFKARIAAGIAVQWSNDDA